MTEGRILFCGFAAEWSRIADHAPEHSTDLHLLQKRTKGTKKRFKFSDFFSYLPEKVKIFIPRHASCFHKAGRW